MTRPTPASRPDDRGAAHLEEAASAAAAAHGAFADALGMLNEFTGGASLMQVEWQLIQQLAQQAARLFDDLNGWHARDLELPLPRRWWEPPWSARDFDPPLKPWEWQRTVRTRTVEQVVVAGTVEVDEEDTNAEQWSFWVRVWLLGNDGIMRREAGYYGYPRAEHPEPPLKVGELGPDELLWTELEIGDEAKPLELEDLGPDSTEHLLRGFAELAARTRDSVARRIDRLREAALSGPGRETNPRLPS